MSSHSCVLPCPEDSGEAEFDVSQFKKCPLCSRLYLSEPYLQRHLQAAFVLHPNTLNLDPDPEFLPNLDPYPGLGMFLKTLFCSQFPVLRPGIFNLSLCTIFGRMPGFKPELLRPQPGVLPVSYTHPFLREKIKLFLEKNCLKKFKSVESPWIVNVCL